MKRYLRELLFLFHSVSKGGQKSKAASEKISGRERVIRRLWVDTLYVFWYNVIA
ncbi:hypothetical protein DEHRE_08180 [Dehalobacter restrictus DSM 9455]|uniref:Uncharacterized protein n=1 Tax=Dehalobacter restrictus (strain DSM 9455 / PER-K23) TaxID=871738 RepID=A0ABN4C164_DEHRP|nr:hypothetical protein DEHRE_08180 [Dehalobacter restrictus DSM 9455]